jgi:hypothetical protein
MSKKNKSAFASGLGRHTSRSLGNDVGLDKLAKLSQGDLSADKHKVVHEVFENVHKVLRGSGLKIGERLTATVVETGINSLVNNLTQTSNLSALTSVSRMGENKSTYTTIVSHIGPPTTDRVKKQLNTPLCEYCEKSLSDTDKDYIQHNKRKYLTLKGGFNEKTISFMMEDTYVRVKDLLHLYSKDPRVARNIKLNRDGVRDVYGCVYKFKNQFKFKNMLTYHSVVLRLHLIKITDINDDVRSLISECTNNKSNVVVKQKDKKDVKLDTKEDQTFIDKAKRLGAKLITEETEQMIQKSNMSKEVKENLREVLKQTGTRRGAEFGRIPEDDQYTDPNLMDKRNKFAVSFQTSIKTQLTDSIQFRDRAKILKTWNKVLTPGSIWDFQLSQHCGKGIHLNYLFDIEALNKEHPAQYTFVLESFGDRRASVLRKEDGDFFNGFGPSKVSCDFVHKICYLGMEHESEFREDAIPTVYKTKKREEDFVENSEFAQIFSPNREEKFHLPFDEIQVLEDGKKGSDKKYSLQYDTNFLPDTSLMDGIKFNYENHGYEGKDLTEDDANYNLKKGPSIDDYEGTGGKLGDILDLDEN